MKTRMLLLFESGILLVIVGMFLIMGPSAPELIRMHRTGVMIMLLGWTVIGITAVLQLRKEKE